MCDVIKSHHRWRRRGSCARAWCHPLWLTETQYDRIRGQISQKFVRWGVLGGVNGGRSIFVKHSWNTKQIETRNCTALRCAALHRYLGGLCVGKDSQITSLVLHSIHEIAGTHHFCLTLCPLLRTIANGCKRIWHLQSKFNTTQNETNGSNAAGALYMPNHQKNFVSVLNHHAIGTHEPDSGYTNISCPE